MHKSLFSFLPSLLIFCGLFFHGQQAHAEDAALAKIFQQAGKDGTIYLQALQTGQSYIHNEARAKQAFTPASTFKIINTLIGLEEGAVQDANSPFAWDGKVHEIENWNQDQTLATAFQRSCVWCYQEIAKRVGAAKYPGYIQQAKFGQLDKKFVLTQFWLDSSLKINAVQQIAFLKQLVQRSLPYQESSYEILKGIMLAEETASFRMYAKTGWSGSQPPKVGWYVGYVETKQETWLFALNMTIDSPADLGLRKQFVMQALRSKGIIPAQ